MAVTEFQEVRSLSPFIQIAKRRLPNSSPICQTLTTNQQQKVYALLLQIPSGRVTSYAALARALQTSPRAIGGALRRNPFAPEVPCHRCIAVNGFIGGFFGDWEKAPSGQNQTSKLALLKEEGVEFDGEGYLVDGDGGKWFEGFEV
ncbi:hypothetical protein Q7P36_003059 [Cladosporium allicinum]